MTETTNLKTESRAAVCKDVYEPPAFQRTALTLITQGGSPGANDSGSLGTRQPPGTGSMPPENDSREDI